MAKILVLGYYDRHNLGDEMFKIAISKIFEKMVCHFISTDDFNGNNNDYDYIICGGGDIINNYFHDKIKNIIKGFEGNIFALGIGIPYRILIHEGYLDIYDHVFIREKTDLLRIQRRLGSQYAHYLPDLAFVLDAPKNNTKNKYKIEGSNLIGIFLIQSIYNIKHIIYQLIKLFEYILDKGHTLVFYAFNTSDNIEESDNIINNEIYEILSVNYERVFIEKKEFIIL